MVLVDGEIACRATPCALPLGVHEVSMHLELHETRRERVTIDAAGLRWPLRPRFGTVSVLSTPAGVAVSVDGQTVGATPLLGLRVQAGQHEVQVGGVGCYRGSRRLVVVAAGSQESLNFTVEPVLAALEVRTYDDEGNVVGAEVDVDGTPVAVAPAVVAVPVCSALLELRPEIDPEDPPPEQLRPGRPVHRIALALEAHEVTRFDLVMRPGHSGPVTVRHGAYQIGIRRPAAGQPPSEPVLDVSLTYDVWVQSTEVTQQQWLDVAGNDPSGFVKCGRDCPVERVSWFDAVHFTNLLSARDGYESCYELTGCKGTFGTGCNAGAAQCDGDYICQVRFKGVACEGYRLPTETEWELAAAGDRSDYLAGDVGWFQGNSGNSAHPVAEKATNSLGMFDVFGNVSEWTHDFYAGTRPSVPQTDWVGPPSGRNRTAKGSAYLSSADQMRAGYRYGVEPEFRGTGLGFRIARTVR